MEIGKFQPPPHKIDTCESIDKKTRHSWLRPQGDPVYQIWYKYTHWELLYKLVKYNKNYLFIYTFSLRLAYRSDMLTDFYAR